MSISEIPFAAQAGLSSDVVSTVTLEGGQAACHLLAVLFIENDLRNRTGCPAHRSGNSLMCSE